MEDVRAFLDRMRTDVVAEITPLVEQVVTGDLLLSGVEASGIRIETIVFDNLNLLQDSNARRVCIRAEIKGFLTKPNKKRFFAACQVQSTNTDWLPRFRFVEIGEGAASHRSSHDDEQEFKRPIVHQAVRQFLEVNA